MSQGKARQKRGAQNSKESKRGQGKGKGEGIGDKRREVEKRRQEG